MDLAWGGNVEEFGGTGWEAQDAVSRVQWEDLMELRR